MNINELDTASGPLFTLTRWTGNHDDDETGKHIVSTPGLTGSTTKLVEVGLSLYNGYSIGLDEVFGSMTSNEMFKVFVQACKIRARKPFPELS
jgi:hypothetical protein